MLPRQETVDRWSGYLLEAGWLFALALVPLYFNPFSARIFEPDKVAVFRALVLLMVAVGVVRFLNCRGGAAPSRSDLITSPVRGSSLRHLIPRWLMVICGLFLGTFTLATVLSVAPRVSLWGSYARADGLHTHLAYVAFFILLLWSIRSRQQIERVLLVMFYSGLTVAAYGLLQRAGWDPLPWNADVPDRVTSTLGNPIFVGAYLGMVMPLGLRWIVQLWVPRADSVGPASAKIDPVYLAGRLMLIGSTLALLMTVIKLLAVMRDSVWYAWVLPGAIAVSVSAWLLRREEPSEQAWISIRQVAIFSRGYLLALAVALAGSAGRSLPLADDRWAWFIASTMGMVGGFACVRHAQEAPGNRSRFGRYVQLSGVVIAVLAMLAAILFTQSRGPWLGAAASLVLFGSLWLAHQYLQVRGAALVSFRLLASILVSVLLLVMIGVIWLNRSDAPAAQALRSMPYLDRLGRLIESESGTGLQRRLFWLGDHAGGGAAGLLVSNQARLVYGWGPESLLLVYEAFYPPTLGPLLRYLATDRFLAPDRTHQVLLDILVTRGILGLLSYLALVGGFVMLIFRAVRGADMFGALLGVAALASVGGSLVEQQVGIPVAATMLAFWTLFAIIARAPFADAYERANATIVPVTTTTQNRRSQRRPTTTVERRVTPFALAVYALLGVGAVTAVSLAEFRPVYADVRFLEGRTVLEQRPDDVRWRAGMAALISAVRNAPSEDLYWLVLGQTLARAAEQQRTSGTSVAATADLGVLDDLLAMTPGEGSANVPETAATERLLRYAELAMLRAHALTPQSKEHVLALARLHRVWFEWVRAPGHLERSAAWYQLVTDLAPHDVPLLLERARFLAFRASLTRAPSGAPLNDDAQASELIRIAGELLPNAPEVARARQELVRPR